MVRWPDARGGLFDAGQCPMALPCQAGPTRARQLKGMDVKAQSSCQKDNQARRAWLLPVVVCGLLLAGCSSSPPGGVQVVDRNSAAPANRPPPASGGQYIVQRGDTLYSIAFRFGWDWKALAARNGIAAPYLIKPGQIVRFDSGVQPAATRTVSLPPAKPVSASPSVSPVTPMPPSSKPVAPPAAPAPAVPAATAPAKVAAANPPPLTSQVVPVQRSATGWAWPAKGPLIGRFSSNGSLNKGIDIAGELGQPVLAASDGTVVYAGSGLRGYGELVIIKHSDIYVSAYGHNRRLLVREGQKVKAGQIIAEMGSTGADRVKLHFEIRRQGKPVDPLQYLPSR